MKTPVFAQQLPTCAVCNKPVERIIWWTDHARCQKHCRVECHGATEEVVLTEKLLYAAEGTLTMGRAFVAPLLPMPQPERSKPRHRLG